MTQTRNGNDVVNVLWTGGWDSTFRILQLSTKDIIIQPHYLKDNRKSENFELNTIRSITEEIQNLSSTKCTILDLISMNVSDINEDKDITQAYENLTKDHKLGEQYEWLARYAKNIDNLEIGDENGSAQDSIIYGAIKANGDVIKIDDDKRGGYYIIDKSVSSSDITKVFGNYHYPILFYSKLEMKKEAEEMGLIDIMNKTWFCHKPIDNQPCGRCTPCMGTIKKGLEYRLSKAALERYRRQKVINAIRSTYVFRSLKKLKKLYETDF